LDGRDGAAYDVGVAGQVDRWVGVDPTIARPAADDRRMPMSGVELPPGGTVEWPASSHYVVANKTRLPQNLRKCRVLMQFHDGK